MANINKQIVSKDVPNLLTKHCAMLAIFAKNINSEMCFKKLASRDKTEFKYIYISERIISKNKGVIAIG